VLQSTALQLLPEFNSRPHRYQVPTLGKLVAQTHVLLLPSMVLAKTGKQTGNCETHWPMSVGNVGWCLAEGFQSKISNTPTGTAHG